MSTRRSPEPLLHIVEAIRQTEQARREQRPGAVAAALEPFVSATHDKSGRPLSPAVRSATTARGILPTDMQIKYEHYQANRDHHRDHDGPVTSLVRFDTRDGQSSMITYYAPVAAANIVGMVFHIVILPAVLLASSLATVSCPCYNKAACGETFSTFYLWFLLWAGIMVLASLTVAFIHRGSNNHWRNESEDWSMLVPVSGTAWLQEHIDVLFHLYIQERCGQGDHMHDRGDGRMSLVHEYVLRRKIIKVYSDGSHTESGRGVAEVGADEAEAPLWPPCDTDSAGV